MQRSDASDVLTVPRPPSAPQLALRFYDPLTGSVTLDGVPLSDLNVDSFVSPVSASVAIVS